MITFRDKIWAIIPSAGLGTRFGTQMPKQYSLLEGKTVIEHSVQRFLDQDWIEKIVVPLSPADQWFGKLSISKSPKLSITQGGATRQESVLNGLYHLSQFSDPNEWVFVHDACRPCLCPTDLVNLAEAICVSDGVGGILAAPIPDTVKYAESFLIQKTQDRTLLWRALTPQVFKIGLLREALKKCALNQVPVTDESSAIEYLGLKPRIVEGKATNIKITCQTDLLLASCIIKSFKETLVCE